MLNEIARAASASVANVFTGTFARRGQSKAQGAVEVEHNPDLVIDRHNRMVAKHNQLGDLRKKGIIKVADLMTARVAAVNHSTPINELRGLMNAQRTRHLLVEEDDLLIGIISDRDLVEKRGRIAADVMTPDPITASPSNPLGDAVKLLLGKRISCLPVVEHGRPCGIITTTDLLLALQCFLNVPEKAVLQTEHRTCSESVPNEMASSVN